MCSSDLLAAGIPPVNPFDVPPGESKVYTFPYNAASPELKLQTVMPFLSGGVVAFSPDMTKYLYYTPVSGTTFNLNIGYMDGSPATLYTTDEFAFDPVWSPDSQHFYYATGSGDTSTPYVGAVGAAPVAILEYTNPMHAVWIDANRYLVFSYSGHVSKLLLGTIGAPAGVIYDHAVADPTFLTFSVNR